MRITKKIAGLGFALALGVTGVAGSAALAADQDRLRDGTCLEDCEPLQDQLRDQDQDHVALQDRDQLKDGSCLDGAAPLGDEVRTQTRAHVSQEAAGVQEQTRAGEQTGQPEGAGSRSQNRNGQ